MGRQEMDGKTGRKVGLKHIPNKQNTDTIKEPQKSLVKC